MTSRDTPASETRPPMAVVQEKRFAVVMYGGVSLAIYINGVVQELLKMVRATAVDESGERALYADSELVGTEKVYRRLSQSLGGPSLARDPAPDDPIRVRFVVDILSGTSAGGINSIFLAKALARNQRIDKLEDLWIQEGDIALLINDRLSTKGTGLDPQKPPRSLLNSKRMYRKLMVALKGMNAARSGNEPPLVEELDLFITATDITGLPIDLQLADRVVRERRHRQVFHFGYRSPDHYGSLGACDDFTEANDSFLAFAARCTSSFPFAFEPMRLADIDGAVSLEWAKFYRDYLAAGGEDAPIDFTNRAFGDGGYIDNKPFSYAIEELGTRSPQAPTDRLLIYIEPNPEKVSDAESKTPNALENTSAALSLARYETIREDLQRILDRNRLLDRVDRILCGSEEDIVRGEKEGGWDVNKWLETDLAKMIKKKGISYGSYLRLRVELLTDELTRLVVVNSDWDPQSDESRAIRLLVSAWRDASFCYYVESEESNKKTFHQFLLDYDLSFYIRRLEFVLRKANEMLSLGGRARKCLEGCGCRDLLDSEEAREPFQKSIAGIRRALAGHLLELRLRRDKLFQRDESGELVGRIVEGMDLDRTRLLAVLEEEREAERASEAANSFSELESTQKMLDGAGDRIQRLASLLADYVDEAVGVVVESKQLVGFERQGRKWVFPDQAPSDPEGRAAWALGYYMHRFSLYDLITLPILYATGVADEHDPIEVIRISPRDAKSLIDEETDSRKKLGGTALANFGAFLDRGWRENDILWGRLDGAERLVHAMLPRGEIDLKNTLIESAHESILEDFAEHRSDAAVTQLTHDMARVSPEDGEERRQLDELRRKLGERGNPSPFPEKVVTATLLASLRPKALREFFGRDYEIYREPDRESTVRSLARATRVTGQILEQVADDYSTGQKTAAWVTRLGRLFWGLVEVSVPQSLAGVFVRHWQRLLLLFSVLMILGGMIFTEPGVRVVGWGALGVVVVFGLVHRLLGDYMRHRGGFKRFAVFLGVVVALALAVNGFLYLDEAWVRIAGWLVGKAPWLEKPLEWVAGRLP